MNHDATHCANFCKDCPIECYRAQLAIDLQNKWEKFINIPLSYSYLYGTEECILSGKNERSER